MKIIEYNNGGKLEKYIFIITPREAMLIYTATRNIIGFGMVRQREQAKYMEMEEQFERKGLPYLFDYYKEFDAENEPMRCTAITKKGNRCEFRKEGNDTLCRIHKSYPESEVK